MNRIHSDDELMKARSQVCVEHTCGDGDIVRKVHVNSMNQRHSKSPFILFIHYSFYDFLFRNYLFNAHLIVQWIKYLDKYIVYV